MSQLTEMLEFIGKSPVSYFAVENVSAKLKAAGFTELRRLSGLVPGGKYFITRNDSALIAFRLPRTQPQGFILSAAHTDSPCLKLRDDPELTGPYIRLQSERYGGMINMSWIDRPLGIAGRVLVRTGEGLASRLFRTEKPAALIPNVAIHLNRGINDAVSYQPGKDLPALFSMGETGSFRAMLAKELGVAPEDILGQDLYLIDPEEGFIWGPEGEFVSAPRLDDLACVYACLEAFLAAEETDRIQVYCAFDNEEVGSDTKQGAGSDLLPRVLSAVSRELGLSPADHEALLDNSFMLSCDNGHAKHPNHPELADSNEAPLLGRGPVLKHSPKYATDGVSCALFRAILDRKQIPCQLYANRPDQAGGGTLGLIADTATPVYTVDIGLPQLAMHSSLETMGSRDLESFIAAVQAVYEARPYFEKEGVKL